MASGRLAPKAPVAVAYAALCDETTANRRTRLPHESSKRAFAPPNLQQVPERVSTAWRLALLQRLRGIPSQSLFIEVPQRHDELSDYCTPLGTEQKRMEHLRRMKNKSVSTDKPYLSYADYLHNEPNPDYVPVA